jgi:hypothetical protein
MTTTRSAAFGCAALAALVLLDASFADARCAPQLRKRTPSQVVADHEAAFAAGDWEAVACNYHPKAYVLDDQGVLVGPEDIVASLQGLHALLDGALPVVVERLPFRDVVRILYTLDAGWFAIPDGVHTYVIRRGKIRQRTSHGLIEFTGPPPDGP